MRRRFCPFSLFTVICLVLVPGAHAQQATLTGTVTDRQTGEPLAAVQVFIEEPSIGALTQQNGRFLLAGVPAGTHSVTAQRIGYTSSTVEVTATPNETTLLDFQLTEEALGLDEIIVTGTPGGTQRRAIGNAVATLEAAQVTQEVAVLNMQDLLTARTPGVQFARAGGNVGTGSAIEVRGTGSFNLGSNPLIYVDGVRVNNNSQAGPDLGNEREVNVLNDFNPQDIESIEIIKGPAAATLYGTEASAGVIQIITKRGAEGEAQFNASVRMGTNYLRNPAARIGTKWTCQGSFDPPCREGEGLVPYNAYEESNILIDQGAFPWPQDELFQSGLSQSYNLGVRGGAPRTTATSSPGTTTTTRASRITTGTRRCGCAPTSASSSPRTSRSTSPPDSWTGRPGSCRRPTATAESGRTSRGATASAIRASTGATPAPG